MNKIKAIENPNNVCFKCLKDFKDEDLHKITISELGYGSSFDGFSTKIHLCNDCIKETNSEWWELETISDEEYYEEYKYEDDILNYIKTLPVQSKELFYNRFPKGYNADNTMEPQDWIDYELDLLPHDKCKEYGCYSPEERQAYKEKFPVCDNVRVVVYGDGSVGSKCPFGAFGNKDGTPDEYNISKECYQCMVFAKRKGEIENLNYEDMEIFELESKLILAKLKKHSNTK